MVRAEARRPPSLVLVAAFAAAQLLACSPAEQAPRGYRCEGCNVLLISMDTLRADHVGAYGYDRRPTTPNIDALAERGVLFENAIAQSSWTRPTHMSMFTGLYPREHGFVALADRKRLSDGVPTLAGVLSERGYATAAFSGGVNMAPIFGFDQGFDLYRVNGRTFRDNLEEAKYWLDREAEQPFFMFYHGYDPHTPYRSDPIDRKAVGLTDPPPGKRFRRVCKRKGMHQIKAFIGEYDGGVRRGDRYVGKLLAHMKESGVLDNTVVIFLSDHGEEFLEHGRCFHLTTVYREVLHVPLIFAGPGLEPRRVPELVPGSVPVAATVLDILGIEDHSIPGPSLAPALIGVPPRFDYVHSETSRRADLGVGEGYVTALTGTDEKLIHWETKGEYAYFDLRKDPGEQEPITEGPQVDRLAAILAEWAERHEGAGRPAGEELSEAEVKELDEKLRALGYAE